MFKNRLLILLIPLFLHHCFLLQKSYPTPEKLLDADKSWTETTLQNMSLDQKIGQMIFIKADKIYVNEQDPDFDALKKMVTLYKVGGVLFDTGNAFQRALVINHLQTISSIPLMIAGSADNGPDGILEGTTGQIPAMAIAATDDPQNAYDAGTITAVEARVMGYHLLLSPCLSLYEQDDAEPLTLLQSFGSEPQSVSTYALEYMRGLQDHGILAAATYFPVKSPTGGLEPGKIPLRLDTIQMFQEREMVPFLELIKNNVAAVVTGHVGLPNYDIGYERPATFSSVIIEDLLKTKLRFNGLVISDRLDKKSITDHYYEGFAAVNAIEAGVDVLLAPENVQATFHAVRNAVQTQRLSIDRINQSVEKILRLKSVLGLNQNALIFPMELIRKLHQPVYSKKINKMASRSITLCRNVHLPLSPERQQAVLLLGFSTSAADGPLTTALEQSLSPYFSPLYVNYLTNQSADVLRDSVLSTVGRSDLIINVFTMQPDTDPSPRLLEIMQEVVNCGKPVINLIIGPPSQAIYLGNAPNLLFTYSDIPASLQAAADAIIGKNGISGKLPVTVGDLPRGSGETLAEQTRTATSIDYRAYLPHPEYIDSLKSYLNIAIADSAFPGCAIAAGFNGRIFLQDAWGNFTYDQRSRKVTTNTLFDLASLTKVVATTTIAMMLYDNGELKLDWKVSDIIPEFKGNFKERVTIRNLLTHTAGLPGWKKFYLDFRGKEPVVQEICNTDLIYEPGTKSVYSDLGMILMQRIIETVKQKPLDLLVREYLTGPLNMTRTMFNPDRSLLNDIVPTEISDWHGGLVRGVVHDENAMAMGGVSGHAGLFSTVEDLSRFCLMYLSGGMYNYNRLLSAETIQLFRTRQNLVEGSSRALGWDTRAEAHSMAGDLMSMQAFGHSGFTGTTIWMDPANQVFVVFLTNRVHPTRDNHKISRVRPRVHNYIMKAVQK